MSAVAVIAPRSAAISSNLSMPVWSQAGQRRQRSREAPLAPGEAERALSMGNGATALG